MTASLLLIITLMWRTYISAGYLFIQIITYKLIGKHLHTPPNLTRKDAFYPSNGCAHFWKSLQFSFFSLLFLIDNNEACSSGRYYYSYSLYFCINNNEITFVIVADVPSIFFFSHRFWRGSAARQRQPSILVADGKLKKNSRTVRGRLSHRHQYCLSGLKWIKMPAICNDIIHISCCK